MMTTLMRHMAENLVAPRCGSPWPKGTKDEVLLQKLPVECFPQPSVDYNHRNAMTTGASSVQHETSVCFLGLVNIKK